jgi:hypothetical protein
MTWSWPRGCLLARKQHLSWVWAGFDQAHTQAHEIKKERSRLRIAGPITNESLQVLHRLCSWMKLSVGFLIVFLVDD